MPKELRATPDTVHWGYYSGELKPVLEVEPGEEVKVETFSYPRYLQREVPELITEPLRQILRSVKDAGPGGHLLTGPIYVKGAQPGDTIAIHIESAEPSHSHGYNMIRGDEGMGTLPQDFPEARFLVLELDSGRQSVRLPSGLSVPLRPFFGNIGVAPPPSWGRLSSRIPGAFGGNLDLTELHPPATLYLPVFLEGALVSIGDGHGVQGDGEVCLSALEISMQGLFKFTVHKNWPVDQPMAETPTHIITLGLHEDLNEAVRIAARNMITWLEKRHGIDRLEAYTFCSLAMDLRVSQVVNVINGVHAMVPKSLLPADGGAR